ncbi:unnamed protein product [Cuscuta epithymum]|uniref:Uncharacterized protein n=1 Tax=Cuscuta epithymum TaxID=186058 RepID=A0AAV0FGI5_9ASTE|nr:unnamed protein product [Cuscuta epithymum]
MNTLMHEYLVRCRSNTIRDTPIAYIQPIAGWLVGPFKPNHLICNDNGLVTGVSLGHYSIQEILISTKQKEKRKGMGYTDGKEGGGAFCVVYTSVCTPVCTRLCRQHIFQG